MAVRAWCPPALRPCVRSILDVARRTGREPSLESASRHAELAGRGSAIAAILVEHARDVRLLDLLERPVDRPGAFGGGGGYRRRVVGFVVGRLAHHDRALDEVAQ